MRWEKNAAIVSFITPFNLITLSKHAGHRAYPMQRKYSAYFHNHELISETCESMTEEGTLPER